MNPSLARKKLIVGAHVAPERPLAEAKALGADCVQVFLSDPQGWRKPPPREDAAELRRSPIPLYVHAPYLINVCSPRNNVRYGSRKILQQTCDAAAEVGAEAVVVHPGHAEDGVAEGVGRWVRTLEMLESEVTAADREHRRRRERGRPPLRRPRPALGGDLGGQLGDRARLLLRHLPRPCRRGGALRRGRAGACDRRPDRPPACERLAGPARNGRRPPRQSRQGRGRGRGAAGDDPRRRAPGGGRDPGRRGGHPRRPRVRALGPCRVVDSGGSLPAFDEAPSRTCVQPASTTGYYGRGNHPIGRSWLHDGVMAMPRRPRPRAAARHGAPPAAGARGDDDCDHCLPAGVGGVPLDRDIRLGAVGRGRRDHPVPARRPLRTPHRAPRVRDVHRLDRIRGGDRHLHRPQRRSRESVRGLARDPGRHPGLSLLPAGGGDRRVDRLCADARRPPSGSIPRR